MRRFWTTLGRMKAIGVVRLVVALQLVLGLVGIGTWRLDLALRPDLPAGARPLPDDQAPRPATLEGSYDLALARVLNWDRHPRLISVSQQVFWPEEVVPAGSSPIPASGVLIYLFANDDEDDAETYSVVVERAEGTIVDERIVPWDHPPASPDLAPLAFPVTSDAALRAADAVEGATFRRACPAQRSLSWLTLSRTPEGQPIWRVTYRDEREGDRNSLTIDVSTETVQIVNVVRHDVPCEGEAP